MPPQVKKWGSVTILTTIFTGLATTGLLWAFGEINSVAPLKTSVDLLIKDNKEHHVKVDTKLNAILDIVHSQEIKLSEGKLRIDALEEKCEQTSVRLRECEFRQAGVPIFTISPNEE